MSTPVNDSYRVNSGVKVYAGITGPSLTLTPASPASGLTGVASNNFTVALVNGVSSVTVTPASSPGATLTPSSLNLTTGSPTGTFTLTPSTSGAHTVSITNNGAINNPSSVSYTASVIGATAFTLTGPTTGTTGQASSNFTVTPNGILNSTVTVTPAGTGATFSPTSLVFTSGTSAAQTFTATRAADGSTSISITNNGGLTNIGSPISYTSSSASATIFTLTGPTTGTTGQASSNFTVTPNGVMGSTVTVTPAGSGATFSPTTLTFTSGSSAVHTFTATRAADGSTSVSITNNGGLTNAGTPISYTSSTSTAQITLGFDTQTPEQISIYCPTTRTVDTTTTVAVRYKITGSGTWSTGHQLLHIRPTEITSGAPETVVDAFAGAIFDLTPGTTYDVELTVTEPGYSNTVLTGTRATRSLPALAGVPNKLFPSMGGTLQTAFNGLAAGDVIELAAGTYNVNNLYLSISGTSNNLIYIRGASRTGTIIKNTTAEVLVIQSGVSHVVLENLTIEGSSTDSGTAATSAGVQFNPSLQTNVTIRNCNFVGVDRGIKVYSRVISCLVYGCDMTGNNTWDKTYTINPASGGPNYTWNDDGICLGGLGNAAWNNTLRGFGDAFASYGSYDLAGPVSSGGLGYESAAVYYYRNLIERTGDDGLEVDSSTRNIGFYDNWIGNCGTFLSSDGTYGGPIYCFRNVCINAVRSPWKLKQDGYGHLIYNNTVLRTDSTGYLGTNGMYVTSGNYQRAMVFANNLLVYRGPDTTLAFTAAVERIDFDHNAWYALNQGYDWYDGSYSTLAAAVSGLPTVTNLFGSSKRHVSDVVTTSNPWVSTITLGADITTEYTGGVVSLALSGGNAAKGSGRAISGITDGFSGGAPDMGAFITGRPAVAFGVPVRPVDGTVTALGYAYGSHPVSGKKAIFEEIAPIHQAWPSVGAPYAAGNWSGQNSYGFASITAYCAPVYDPIQRRIMRMGGGHVAYCVPTVATYDVTGAYWDWANLPPPSDCYKSLGGNPPTSGNLLAAYPGGQIDAEGSYLGSYGSWAGGFSAPGDIFPEAGHNDGMDLFIPGTDCGNTKGIYLKLTPPGGATTGGLIVSRAKLNLDTNKWQYTTNGRQNPSVYSGWTAYAGGSIKRAFALTRDNGGYSYGTIDVFNPATDTWKVSNISPDVIVSGNNSGCAHLESGLVLYFAPIDAGGVESSAGPNVGYRVYAAKMANIVANEYTFGGSSPNHTSFTPLTVTLTAGWPTRTDNTITDIGFVRYPGGTLYAVNGRHNSTTLWRLKPNPAAVTPDDHLSMAWELTTETIQPLPNHDAGGGTTTGSPNVYNSLMPDPVERRLLYQDSYVLSPVYAIYPAGL